MPVLPASDCIDRFLAVMRHCAPDARTAAELCQSVDAWGAYYRALRIALEGNILAGPANRAGCFFLFAQATLDGIAETVRGFFSLPWTRAAFSHRRLTQEFPRLCVVYHLTGETQDIQAHLCALQTRIVERRTAGSSFEQLYELLRRIEQYIAALLTFLAQNGERCGVRHDILPQPASVLYPCGKTRYSPALTSVPWPARVPMPQRRRSWTHVS